MYTHNHYVDQNYLWRETETQYQHQMTKKFGNFKNMHTAIPLSPTSPPYPSTPMTPNFYSSSPSPHASPSPSSHWNFRMAYPVPSPTSHYPPTPTSTHVPISPLSSPMVNNSVAFLEEILSREHTICLQVRSLSTTIAKLTKDVLATGKACPTSFVGVLKDQVAKMQHLLATLNLIEQNKRSFPPDFVKEVTLQWQQRASKQRGNRKRKGSEPYVEEFKVETPTMQDSKPRKIVIPKQQIIKSEPQTPNELMNINSIIN